MSSHAERRVPAAMGGPAEPPELDPRVRAERVRILYSRAAIAQATVVVNALLVCWVFRSLVPPAQSLSWAAALCALAALRMGLVRAYRRRAVAPSDAWVWARRFTAGAALTGIGWGAGALVFYAPRSPLHEVFFAFVLGGMAAGAASSNATCWPAFVAFAAPALLPMVLRLGAAGEPARAAMAFMLTLFGLAMAWFSSSSGRAITQAIRLRIRNEALVEGLTSTQQRLENLNAELERRVDERTSELERTLALRIASEARLAEAHAELRESDRRKDQFLALLSHELRNPLAAIRNGLVLLDRAAPGGPVAGRALEIVQRQTEHLARLVDDLLDVTRISRGKIELRRARVDVCDLTRRTCEDHRGLFQTRGIELRVDTGEPLWIEADETRIAQVVGNLLLNAAKFSEAGGRAIASVRAAGDRVEIRVRDDGIGMPRDLLSRVFEPFVQGEAGLVRSRDGLGLGLALTKSLVELHGGWVRADSAGAGCGSEFVVNLPLAPAPSFPAPELTGTTRKGAA